MPPPVDPEVIRRQYQTKKHLRARQDIHDTYTIPKQNYAHWILSKVNWRGDEVVLDAGCGTGHYANALSQMYPGIRYYGSDLSLGILAEHPTRGHACQCDVTSLAYPDNSFDVVMAHHMLYHVPDIDAAVQELRRVLRPGGILMAATSSIHTMPELQLLLRRAITMLSDGPPTALSVPGTISELFALENGLRLLSRHFYAVVRYDLPNALIFPTVAPALDYMDSVRDIYEAQLPDDVAWDDMIAIMQQQFDLLIERLGHLQINKLSGVLVASDDGGFIQPFVEMQQARHHGTAGPL